MKFFYLIALGIIFAFLSKLPAHGIEISTSEQNLFFQEEIPSVKYSLSGPYLSATKDAEGEFLIRVTVPKDHHAYLGSGDKGLFIPLSFDFSGVESAGYKVSLASSPKGMHDKEFEAIVLRGDGEFKFTISRVKGREFIIPPIKARAQICNDITKICYLPQTDEIPLIIKSEITTQTSGAGIIESPPTLPAVTLDTSAGSSSVFTEGEGFTGKVSALYKKYSQNVVMAFIFIFLAGLLASGTPCVYPMIPITSAIIMERGGSNRQQGIYHSLSYFLGIICLYIILGYAAGMTGGAFNAVMQSPVTNLFFAILFGIFGFAMLGFFDFTVGGEDFTTRISSAIGKKSGFFSTFLMGMIAGLIISPCVGPVVFTVLLQVADRIAELNAALAASGSEATFIKKSLIAGQGGLMMGGFGIGIGVPLLLVGLLSNRMPKAGTWMDYVKYALGLIILYIAWVYFMKGIKTAQINDQAAYTILAGIAAVILSIYLGLFRTEKNRIKKGIAFFLLLPAFYFMYNGFSQAGIITIKKESANILAIETTITKNGVEIEKHENLEWYRDFEGAKKVALKENKPIFIDFFAYWCANCLEFEKLSVKNEKLNRILQNAVLVKIYDTDPIFKTFREDPAHRELKTGLPYFAILKSNGEFFWEGTQYNAVETMGAMIKSAS
tara:strand:- start:4568 stop:6562 length:1995 start_codon:yes stop_codon:yes gene_type:complete